MEKNESLPLFLNTDKGTTVRYLLLFLSLTEHFFHNLMSGSII